MHASHKIPAIAATLIWLLGSTAGAAQAAERHAERTRQGPNGGSVAVQRDRDDGLQQRSVERYGPAGRSLEAQRSRSYDPGTGTYQGGASRTVTGLNGQSASRNREVTREGGQATVTRQTTGPNGQTSTYQRSRGDGQSQAVWSGPNGQAFGRSRSVEHGDQGVTVQTQTTGPGGTRDRSVTYVPAGGE
ncbi:MAG: hypothetical protein PHP86_13370 [Nevskiales bacterium]|nr:hypothetical protein [Nevskiales bacterium]